MLKSLSSPFDWRRDCPIMFKPREMYHLIKVTDPFECWLLLTSVTNQWEWGRISVNVTNHNRKKKPLILYPVNEHFCMSQSNRFCLQCWIFNNEINKVLYPTPLNDIINLDLMIWCFHWETCSGKIYILCLKENAHQQCSAIISWITTN